jgi:uncharacterized membrane protein YdfJ with MMPL/SSD domain
MQVNRTFDRRYLGSAANARRALVAFVLALAVMAMFLSESLQSYAYDLPESAVTEDVIAAIDTWHGGMQELGTADAAARFVEAVEALHEARFGE